MGPDIGTFAVVLFGFARADGPIDGLENDKAGQNRVGDGPGPIIKL